MNYVYLVLINIFFLQFNFLKKIERKKREIQTDRHSIMFFDRKDSINHGDLKISLNFRGFFFSLLICVDELCLHFRWRETITILWAGFVQSNATDTEFNSQKCFPNYRQHEAVLVCLNFSWLKHSSLTFQRHCRQNFHAKLKQNYSIRCMIL